MKHIGLLLLCLIMGTWGCAKQSSFSDPILPEGGSQLLRGKAEIFVRGKIYQDMIGQIGVLIKGSNQSHPMYAGLTVCIQDECITQLVPVGRQRFFMFNVVGLELASERHSVPVAVGLRKIIGTAPLTGMPIYKLKPYVEARTYIPYHPVVAGAQHTVRTALP